MQKFDVRLEITNYCNLKCPHCSRNRFNGKYNLNSKHISFKTVKNWLPMFFLVENVNNVFLSGAVGEPTLNPDCIKIAKYLSNYCTVQLDSNGSTNNETWWKELGSHNIHCVFSPDSLIPGNNKYRINSNTDKVISNMKAFISGGSGRASWKYIPFKHNEDELEEQKKIALDLGAKFLLVQPTPFNLSKEGENMRPSKHFPESTSIAKSYTKNQTPDYYCDILGEVKNLLEISPDGILYPCCYTARCFFITYSNFFTNGDPKPKIYDEMMSEIKYYDFVTHMIPLIENQGGIETFSLNHNTIENILQTDFYKFSLKNSWSCGNNFCNKHCESKEYVFSET